MYFLIDPPAAKPKTTFGSSARTGPGPARQASGPRAAWGQAREESDDSEEYSSDDSEEEESESEEDEESEDEMAMYKTAESAKAAGNRFTQRGEHQKAIECYTRAIELDGKVAAYYGNRAACHLKLSKYSDALADSMKAVEIDAKFGKGWIRAGLAHVRLGSFDEAKSCFKTAMKIRVPPMGTLQFEEMAKTELRSLHSIEKVLPRIAELVEEGETISYKEAERMAANIWKDKCPGHLQLTKHYLLALIANRKWDDVKRVSQTAMGFHGQTPELVTMRGQCLLYMGQIEPAKQCFNKVLRDDPDFRDAQIFKKNILKVDRAKAAANELYKAGKFEEALEGYAEAINIDKLNAAGALQPPAIACAPACAQVVTESEFCATRGAVTSKLYCNRANCHVKLEKWEEAAADATEAITRDDKYSKAFALRGQARMSLENYEDAAKDYNQASQLAPESTEFKKTHKEVPRLFPFLGHALLASVEAAQGVVSEASCCCCRRSASRSSRTAVRCTTCWASRARPPPRRSRKATTSPRWNGTRTSTPTRASR